MRNSNVILYLAMRGLNNGQRMDNPRTVQSVRSALPEILARAESLIREKYPDDPILLHITSAYNALEPAQKRSADWTSASVFFAKGEGEKALGSLQGHWYGVSLQGISSVPPLESRPEPELEESLDPQEAAENARNLIDNGENSRVEFKSTLRFDLAQGKKNESITSAVLKTICGFVNRDGGTVLVGVADDRKVLGLEADKFESEDECARFLADKVSAGLGAECIQFVDHYFVSLEEGTVLVIECKPSHHQPIFLTTEVFVRTGPKTRSLNPKESVQYMLGRLRRAA